MVRHEGLSAEDLRKLESWLHSAAMGGENWVFAVQYTLEQLMKIGNIHKDHALYELLRPYLETALEVSTDAKKAVSNSFDTLDMAKDPARENWTLGELVFVPNDTVFRRGFAQSAVEMPLLRFSADLPIKSMTHNVAVLSDGMVILVVEAGSIARIDEHEIRVFGTVTYLYDLFTSGRLMDESVGKITEGSRVYMILERLPSSTADDMYTVVRVYRQ